MAGTPSLFAGIGAQLFDNNGKPLSGGKIYTYGAGGTTPVATYTTNATTTAHANPITLDSAGRVPSGGQIWLKEGDSSYYKFVVKTASGSTVATYDYVPGTYDSPTRDYLFDSSTPNAITSLLPKKDTYRQCCGVFLCSDNKSTCHVFAESQNHGNDVNRKIYAYNSTDFGRTIHPLSETFSKLTFVYGDDTYLVGNIAFGTMGNGRFGIISGRVLPDTVTYGEPVFIYSDDDGETWTSVPMPYGSSGVHRSDFHGKIYPWPASAGGNDTTGFVAFSYAGAYGIVGWYTTDNGATWTPQTQRVSVASEMSVARIGNENKWVMVIRAGTHGYVSTSADLVTWTSAKQLTSLILDSNPPELIYDNSRLYFFGFSRQGREIQDNASNALLVSKGDPDEVYSSGGDSGWEDWTLVTNLTYWPTGYLKTIKVSGRWYFYFTGSEETSGGSTGRQAIMFLLSNDIPETTTARQILGEIPSTNYLPSGQFSYWPAGASFSSGASRQLVVPGITFARSTGASNASVTREDGEAGAEGRYVLRLSRVDTDTDTHNVNLVCSLTSEDSYNFRDNRVCISFRARCGAGFSGAGPSGATKWLYVKALSSTDPQQTVTSLSGTPTNASTIATANSGVSLNENWAYYEISVGLFPETAEQLFVLLSFNPTGTALDDWVEIEQLKIEVGNAATPFVCQTDQQLKLWSSKFYQTKTVQTENGSRNIPLLPMARTPNVTASVGSVGSITADGFELSHSAAASSSIVANGFL